MQVLNKHGDLHQVGAEAMAAKQCAECGADTDTAQHIIEEWFVRERRTLKDAIGADLSPTALVSTAKKEEPQSLTSAKK